MTTPVSVTPLNGDPTHLNAVESAAHVNQLLSAHPGETIYTGVQIDQPLYGQNFQWYTPALNQDVSQAYTQSGTTLGRVQIPINPVGNGSDLLVTLYPDSSGSPNINSPLASVHVPAAYQTQVAATDGLASQTNPPLATGQNNTVFINSPFERITWNAPASTVNGLSDTSSMLMNNGFMISMAGQDSVTGLNVSTVYTFQYSGGTSLALPTPQPSLPQGYEGCQVVVVGNTILVLGGGSNPTVVSETAVYAASWDANTGTIGSWSNQTALPIGMCFSGSATYGNFVYMVGGFTSTAPQVATANAYVNTVNNGQLGAWSQINSLPVALTDIGCVALNGWLVVFGGNTNSFVGVNTTYYAKIFADGTIGPWQNGPSMTSVNVPGSGGSTSFNQNQCGQQSFTENTIVAFGPSGFTQCLSVTAEGIGPNWITYGQFANPDEAFNTSAGQYYQGLLSDGDGNYSILAFVPNQNNVASVWSATVASVPMVSVPLYATGLTNNATYHVVIQSFQEESASDYTQIGYIGHGALPGGNGNAYQTDLQTSNRYSGTWTNSLPTGSCVPMQVWDASVAGKAIHVWHEPDPQFQVAQRWGSLLYNGNQMVDGIAEVTRTPNLPLNVNPTFTTGVSPWTAVNCTLVQSNAQTHGGFPFSGLLTPTGGNQLAYVDSGLYPIPQTQFGQQQWVFATGWFYSPNGSSHFSLQMNWFDSGQNYVSTGTAGITVLPAATWTQVSHFFQVPANVTFGAVNPVLSNTPLVTDTLYINDCYALMSPESVDSLTGVAQVNYSSTVPNVPLSVTQLA